MAKLSKSENPTTELRHDAWERFERAVDIVAKSPPHHKMRKDKSQVGESQKKIRGGHANKPDRK